MIEYKSELHDYCLEKLDLQLFGVADMKGLEQYLYSEVRNASYGLDKVIVIGSRLSKRILQTIVDHPTFAYKHHYAQANYILDQATFKITNWIAEKGYDALPIAASQVVNYDKQLGNFSHRHAGVQAGLGWIGRNGLLVNPKYGSQVRYATVLTNMPMESDKPLEDAGCGDCIACIRNCPVSAISKDNFDYEKCYSQLHKFKSLRGIGHNICGMCVLSCPGKEQ